jgi:hypothetical protein
LGRAEKLSISLLKYAYANFGGPEMINQTHVKVPLGALALDSNLLHFII